MTDLLETAAVDLIGARSDAEVYRAVADAGRRLLDADRCKVAVAEGGVLVPKATAPGEPAAPGYTLPIDGSLPGRVYSEGEPCVVDDRADVRNGAAAAKGADSAPEYRSLLVVPLGGVGVLVAAANDPDAFTESDRESAERLASYATAALERVGTAADDGSGIDRLEEVAGILSHDLQTPLQVAQGYLELAQATGEDEYFEQVDDAIDRIESLAEDIVMLARTDERIGATAPVDLQQAANEAWFTTAISDVSLEVEDTATVVAHESTLCQLLENLFRNAVEHGGRDVTIRVGVLDDGFYVEDDGPGVPENERERVFEWRHTSSSDQTGLGLSIVRQIVDAHGWEIEITDGTDGGARFEITGAEFA